MWSKTRPRLSSTGVAVRLCRTRISGISNIRRSEIFGRARILGFHVPGQRHPASLFLAICNLLALIVNHGEFPQFWIWVLHDLFNLGRLPSVIASDQLGEFDLVVDGHGSPRDAEERLPLGTQLVDDVLNAAIPNSYHWYALITFHST